MERGLVVGGGGKAEEHDDVMDLPPGFRFHPTDEELVTHYLSRKAADQSFAARAIGEADLNKCEPWDLPWRAKMGEKEWYFFCVKDRKYPTGLRTNRATEAGYWKATGKDKEIHKGKALVGMKKTLVFYTGRAPKGEKTNWVMHEYRLEGNNTIYNLCRAAKNEWVLCRVFHKPPCAKKAFGLPNSVGDELLGTSPLPPLMEDSPSLNGANSFVTSSAAQEVPHVPCFSNAMEGHYYNPSAAFSFPASNPCAAASLFSATMPFSTSAGATNFGLFKAEREVGSASQDTGITTTDMNPEISSSVFSNHELGQQGFDVGEASPAPAPLPPPAETLASDDYYYCWNY